MQAAHFGANFKATFDSQISQSTDSFDLDLGVLVRESLYQDIDELLRLECPPDAVIAIADDMRNGRNGPDSFVG